MQTKTEDLYAIVLIKICEIIPEFSPKIAVYDFERAPRNVFSHYFPVINIIGCWFQIYPCNLEENATLRPCIKV